MCSLCWCLLVLGKGERVVGGDDGLTCNAERRVACFPVYTRILFNSPDNPLHRAPRTPLIHKHKHSSTSTPPQRTRPYRRQRTILVLYYALGNKLLLISFPLLAPLIRFLFLFLGLFYFPAFVQRLRGHTGVEIYALEHRATQLFYE